MAERKSVTLIINEEVKNKVIDHYSNYVVNNEGEYILFFAKKDGLTISIYSSKKEHEFKLIFMGADPLKEAFKWDENAKENIKKNKAPSKASWLCLSDQIGSDEVGTGDLFGPICVAASLVREKDIRRLKELGVDDSKRLSDQDILRIGEILIKEIPYSQVSLGNEKYNELVDKGLNLNEMKAKMHNQVLLNLLKKNKDIKNIFVDQFAESGKYYEYLSDSNEVVKNITFKTKGETYFPCVAVASIIARYSFLKKMEVMSKKYGKVIPFGASKKVTKFASDFTKAFGKEELLKNVKKNFANLKEII